MNVVKVNVAIIVTLLFWASAFVGIRIGLEAYTPGALALLRFLVASGCMWVLNHFCTERPSVAIADRLKLALIGVGGIGLYNVCLNIGEVDVSAGVASFLIGLMPVMTILLSIFFLKERQGKGVWLGIFVSFLGLIAIVLGEQSALSLSVSLLLILIAALSGSIYSIIQKSFLDRYNPITVTAWIIWGGTLSLFGFFPDLLEQLHTATRQATCAVIYLGIFPAAIAYAAWAYVLNYLCASKASIYLYAMPVLSTIMGFVFLNERPTGLSLLGGCLALLGAGVASRAKIAH